MAGFYERRISKAANWCVRLAIIAVPFFILTVILQRTASITINQTFWLISFGIGMVLTSLMFGLRAAADLWEKGYKGGRATVNGIVLSVLLLIPFGIQLFNALENPKLNDVATDVINPPLYLTSDSDLVEGDEVYDDFISREIVSNYPELVPRRYGASKERVIESVLELLNRWEWKIVSSVNLPEAQIASEPEADQEDNLQNNEELAGGEQELAQSVARESDENTADIIVQVEAKSFIMKLPYDIVIRLTSVADGTLVDVRSSSDWGQHDFGTNAKNIVQFLNQLDVSLAGIAGEV